MALTLKSAVIALALFGGALGVYRYTQNMYIHNTDKEVISRKYEASNFIGISYDPMGRKQRSLHASKVTYNEETEIVDFVEPTINTFKYNQNGKTEIWNIRGDTGQLHNNDFAEMKGNVILAPVFKGAAIKKASCEHTRYDFKTNTVTSPWETQIIGEGWLNSGTGFKFDLNTDKITFKSNVNATYLPSVSNKR